MVRLANFCTAMMDAGMNGTHTTSAAADGNEIGARQANSVSGASTA